MVASSDTLRDKVESFILDLLAEEEQRNVEELRAELTAAGTDLPYDSILLVELMTRVRARFGVKLKPTLQTAQDMRSVRGFAERVCLELDEASDGSDHDGPLSGIEGDGLDERDD
ncbi:acyl carrier protein [Saccharothrix obliqua]|uniref:acyl carrier protein n=1 Tax=Saccharothrix obliqua TaxID=2861747 RepID=UPI001C5EACF8|nr:acyl carrier protein [Saccharothrix obliqua]MBW4719798.1 hypothetical protein [Saccharothrix obliqua]